MIKSSKNCIHCQGVKGNAKPCEDYEIKEYAGKESKK